MPASCLHTLLKEYAINYRLLPHGPESDPVKLTEETGIDPSMLAKTIVIIVDGVAALAVTTASQTIRWDKLCRVMGTDFIDLADEAEFSERFPGCEAGAIPPFGTLFGMTVYLDQALAAQPMIGFPAGTQTEIILMTIEDYKRLAKPIVLSSGFARAGQQGDGDGSVARSA